MNLLHQAYLIKGFLLATEAPKEVTQALEAIIGVFCGAKPLLQPGDQISITGTTTLTEIVGGVTSSTLEADSASESNLEKHTEPKQTRKAKTIPAEEADTVRRLVKEEKSDEEIGQELGYPVIAVKNFRKEHEITRPRGNPNHRRSSDMPTASPPPVSTIEIRKAAPQAPATTATPKPKPAPQIDVDRLITVHKGYAGKREDGTLMDSDWSDIKARLAKSPDRKTIASDYDVDLDDLNYFVQSCQRREQRSGEALASPFQQTSGATQRQP